TQHLPGSPVRHPVRQYLAVVANLYRSFLASDKRTSARIPLAEAPALPPLVTFHHDTECGPALLATPITRSLCDSEVPVVVMPGTYCRAPLAWASVAHEACGHGV